MKTATVLIILFGAISPSFGGDKQADAKGYLDQRLVYKGEFTKPGDYDAIHEKVSTLRDPETKLGPFIFALSKANAGVLTPDQIQKVKALMESNRSGPINWHDCRNTIRMQSIIAMWAYAGEADATKAKAARSEWEQWTDLRLAYMFQEFITKHRFQRAVWAIYTPEQRKQITSGELDSLIRKNTGHKRTFSAAKQVFKALGKPDDSTASKQVAEEWERKWAGVVEQYETASKFERQVEFGMDIADEAFTIAARQEYAAAFRVYASAECDAIREIIQKGYHPGDELKQKLARVQKQQRAIMVKKYSDKAGELLTLLNEISE